MPDLRRMLRRGVRLRALIASAIRCRWLRLLYPGLVIEGRTFVGPDCEISVAPGATVILRDLVVGRGCRIVAGADALIDISAHSLGPYCSVVARERVEIGSGTMLAEMCVVRDANHVRDTDGAVTSALHRAAPVVIGSDVWIGARGTVLSGVWIGDGATVGAAAVVIRDVPIGTTVVGVPARAVTLTQEEVDGCWPTTSSH